MRLFYEFRNDILFNIFCVSSPQFPMVTAFRRQNSYFKLMLHRTIRNDDFSRYDPSIFDTRYTSRLFAQSSVCYTGRFQRFLKVTTSSPVRAPFLRSKQRWRCNVADFVRKNFIQIFLLNAAFLTFLAFSLITNSQKRTAEKLFPDR